MSATRPTAVELTWPGCATGTHRVCARNADQHGFDRRARRERVGRPRGMLALRRFPVPPCLVVQFPICCFGYARLPAAFIAATLKTAAAIRNLQSRFHTTSVQPGHHAAGADCLLSGNDEGTSMADMRREADVTAARLQCLWANLRGTILVGLRSVSRRSLRASRVKL